jgi:hypothetical protein
MAVEEREQVTRIGIVRVNGQPEELAGPDGRRPTRPPRGGETRATERSATGEDRRGEKGSQMSKGDEVDQFAQ